MKYEEALRYLDEHASYEKTGRVESPSLENISRFMDLMAQPQFSYPVIHVTGTNGKGSTTQIITKLLMAHGLHVGTYSSPHLESLTERITCNAEQIDKQDFADCVAAIADIEVLAGVRPSYFDIMTAAAFRYFADKAVDVAVIEVGMLGRWDATNVVRSEVAVVTNIALDHTEFAGPTLQHIAYEKVGISKAASSLVIGDENPELFAIWNESEHAKLVRRGEDFGIADNQLAVGGRALSVRTARAVYDDIHLPLHGVHQGDNASVALVAVEEFFDAALNPDIVREGFASVVMPGRFEVLGRHPLVVIDGAHNPAGADVCAEVFFDDFSPEGKRILVFGMLQGRDPEQLLSALHVDEFDKIICCTAPTARGLAAPELAAVVRAMGCDDVVVCDTVEQACERAISAATEQDAVLVAGSLYVVGSARTLLRRIL
jgi:dihydrofolate synthase/folylpolyglutamate synthase